MLACRRIALYSHDAQGLGHLRRNLEVASALVAGLPNAEVLLIGSACGAERLPLPPSTQLSVVPQVVKRPDGSYAAADPRLALRQVLRQRGQAVRRLLGSFAPDLVIVDKLARGLHAELDPALRWLSSATSAHGRRPRLVLGLRDVLDAPATARAEWDAAGTTEAVTSWYDEVWVYGDPAVYDPVLEYQLPEAIAARTRYTGYLAHGRSQHTSARVSGTAPPRAPYVLCMVGGGCDGRHLAESFVRAGLPRGHQGVLVTGPQMAAADVAALRALAADRPALRLRRFLPDPVRWVRGAAAIVSMGGYNAVCEVLASGRPALVVPRVTPRLEQAVRAQRLSQLTPLASLHPDAATPTAVGAWLRDAVLSGPHHHRIDLDGLARIPRLVESLVDPVTTDLEVTHAGA